MLNSKEIIALSDFEHVLTRPTMYIGSIEESDENIQVIEDEKIILYNKKISVGFYKLMHEIIDNAFDEGKRMKGKLKNISINFDSLTSKITVSDDGEGFFNGSEINEKTGLTNIETALTVLRAGSNFKNEESEENLIGTNGVGASIVNMLSDYFEIKTVNKDTVYIQKWEKFTSVQKDIKKKTNKDKTGTSISFIPRTDKFKKYKWDKEYIQTLMTFKNFLKNRDSNLSNIKFEVIFDKEKLNINQKFFADEHAQVVDFKYGYLLLFPHWWASGLTTTRENFGTSRVSFVNGAMCTGSHERIINDWINDIFDFKQAYRYIDSLFILNLPPRLVRFGDQNKTKFATGRWEIEPLLAKHLEKKLKNSLKKTHPLFKLTKDRLDSFIQSENIKALKNQKRRSKNRHQISDKYFPPSIKKESLFIVEGSSAKGGILQKRNAKVDGIYALKGKIKNARSITDLTKNTEIIDLMNILNIEPHNGENCAYEKIVIATDWDCLHENSYIKTIDGQKKIKDITYGDLVLSSDNKYHEVTRISKTSKTEFIEIKINSLIIKCGETHKFIIYRDDKVITEIAKNIKLTDRFLLKSGEI